MKMKTATISKIPTRDSYGSALAELGHEYENLIVLDADLSSATKTDKFKSAFPERHINCGIAENNMVAVAAGLATSGKIPFASSFSMFLSGRSYEQIRNSVAYPHLNVKFGGTHVGITVGEDGATHQCLEDISLMREIPGMVILNPADDVEARACVRAAVEHNGPVYIRFGRAAVPVIYDTKSFSMEIGKGIVLRQGTDVSIFATGLEVYEALLAADMLAKDGINAEVIDIHTIKPIDKELIISSASKTQLVVTAEEHSIIGGLGTAVCELLSTYLPTKVLRIGINDEFTKSGAASDLLHKYELDAEGIYTKIKAFV